MLLLDETSFLKKGSHSVGVTQRDHEHLGGGSITIRPHRSLGYITPLEFAQEEIEEEPPTQCWVSGRAAPSLRPSIDLLYNLEHIINPSRLTKALAQFR